MAIQYSQELFLFQLAQIYDIEQELVQVLPQLAQEMQNHQAQQVFLEHEQETRQHIRNLEHCFEILGCQPVAVENHAVKGLKQDHDSFVQQQQPTPSILMMFGLYAGSQCEYLEMAHYQSLIDAAYTLGYQQCVPFLQENLQQEMATAQSLATIAHQLGQQGVPVHS